MPALRGNVLREFRPEVHGGKMAKAHAGMVCTDVLHPVKLQVGQTLP